MFPYLACVLFFASHISKRLICSLQFGFIHRQKTFYLPVLPVMSGTANIFRRNGHTFKDILPVVTFLLFVLPYKVMNNADVLQYLFYFLCVCVCCFRCPKCNSGQMLNHLCTLILNHSNPPRKRRKKRYEEPVCEEKIFPPTNLASE